MKRVLESLVTLFLLAAVAAGFYNVFADEPAVASTAEGMACGNHGPATCRAQSTLSVRTPIARTFHYVVKGKPIGVRCAREYILVGNYDCKVEGAEAPPSPANPARSGVPLR